MLIFFAELGLFAAAGWLGFARFDGPLQWIVGIGLPVALAAAWGLLLSPKARVQLEPRVAQVIRVALLLGGAAMFVFIGATVPAIVQAVLVVLGTVFGDPVPGRTDDA